MRRGNPNVQMFLPEEEPQRSRVAQVLAKFFVERVEERSGEGDARAGMLIATVNGLPVAKHWIASYLLEAGFSAGAMGFNVRRKT
jgi:ATP-dependent Lhr-like helicase